MVARAPALRGGLYALLAALLFGISTPLVQHFGTGVGAFTTAALLYAGAALVGALSTRRPEREACLVRRDGPRLLAMAALGAVVGPVALAWGLQRTSGASASLMLTLEALFTALLAWRLYRETMDGRVWAAMLLLLAGGMLLVLDQGHSSSTQLWGLLAVLLATAAWGLDNTLSRTLAERDPGQVVMAKAALGAAAATGRRPPQPRARPDARGCAQPPAPPRAPAPRAPACTRCAPRAPALTYCGGIRLGPNR
jgi:drug/metabolite transporter (DMT)-like permease